MHGFSAVPETCCTDGTTKWASATWIIHLFPGCTCSPTGLLHETLQRLSRISLILSPLPCRHRRRLCAADKPAGMSITAVLKPGRQDTEHLKLTMTPWHAPSLCTKPSACRQTCCESAGTATNNASHHADDEARTCMRIKYKEAPAKVQ